LHGRRDLLIDDDLVDKLDFLLDVFFIEYVIFSVEGGEFLGQFDDFFSVLLVLSDELFYKVGSLVWLRAELDFGEGVK
jgi:hypothetical protein